MFQQFSNLAPHEEIPSQLDISINNPMIPGENNFVQPSLENIKSGLALNMHKIDIKKQLQKGITKSVQQSKKNSLFWKFKKKVRSLIEGKPKNVNMNDLRDSMKMMAKENELKQKRT